MMPIRRRVVAFVLLAVLPVLPACSLFGTESDETGQPQFKQIDFSRFSQAPPLLVGRWEWQKSVYPSVGGDPSVLTPVTADRTETLVFSAPPDTVRLYRSDTLARRTAREAFFSRIVEWGVHDDTLATSSAALDGPQKIYERVE